MRFVECLIGIVFILIFGIILYNLVFSNTIKKLFPSLEIELADETDSRLKRYIKQKPGGFKLPLYMLLKNGMYKDHKAGKYRNDIIFAWLQSIPSLNA